MNYTLRLVFSIVSLSLGVPVFSQAAESPAGTIPEATTRSAEPTAAAKKEVAPKPTDIAAKDVEFSGIVIRPGQVEDLDVKQKTPPTGPLVVKSLEGEWRELTLSDQTKPPFRTRRDALIKITYDQQNDGQIILKALKPIGSTLTGTIKEIAADKSWMVARTQRQNNEADHEINVPLQAPDKFKPLVTAMRPGDGIRATYLTEETKKGQVQSLEWRSTDVGLGARWASLLGAAALLLLVAALFTKGSPTQLYLGADKRYSTSKFQTVLWFWVVISAYIAILFHRIVAAGWSYIGGVDIPQNLLILSGISVLSFAAAKAITVGKVEKAEAKGEVAKSSADGPKAANLVQDDLNRTDLGDFQMVVITILAVIIYAISTVEFMAQIEYRRVVTMPDVDATLLAIFGLAQAAYLGKKAAGEVMTSEQATKAASDAAAIARAQCAKALAAEQTAMSKEREASSAAAAVRAAASKVVAEPEVEKAVEAAKAAREAATQAEVASKATAARAKEAADLAASWSKEPRAAASIKSSSDDASREADRAMDAAKNANALASNAEKHEKEAKTAAAGKP